jgi:hypothetical protein
LDAQEAYLQTKEGLMRPTKFAFTDGKEIYVKEYNKDTAGYGAIIYPASGGYRSIVMSTEQTMSVFTRLYFFKGVGLKYFEKISTKTGVDGTEINLFKVNWNPNKELNDTVEVTDGTSE